MFRKRNERAKDKSDKGGVVPEDDPPKITGLILGEKGPAQTFEDYQCSGNLETDFPELCALLGMKQAPAVKAKHPNPETNASTLESLYEIQSAPFDPKPHLQVELENEDPCSVKSIRISGWKMDKLTAQVLNKTLPSLSHLQSLYFWQAGLTDQMVICLKPLFSNLRYVLLEGNPLPEQSYHLLLSEDSNINHLLLRNNQISDEGVRLIGSALSTTRSANSKLMYLNLAFNSIGDAGAEHIAQGLRLNRSLHFLSLSNNQIGDAGAAHLAKILSPFALTHEEVVERRRLLLERDQPPSLGVSAEQSSTHQLLTVSSSTSLSGNVSKRQSKGNFKKRHMILRCLKLVGSVEKSSPLLEPSVQHKAGQIILQGNTILTSLNLAGNRITERSLPLFLSSLQMQTEGGGLLRLCLQRNHLSPDCELYIEIQELMTCRDPLKKATAGQTNEERQGAQY
ncbi:leucine-rich repeat-containing protein 71 [Lampris incognitus]|uniref:leucine-rich repeat-containing protein 71 n=1 Tax=Lampris incognitus TaxID=2546036 RepID=UPI0024B58279|nr:leucine-rich repeat-containing protein 71 [Lampris incognitus]